MQNELERFLANPTARNYLRVRKLILQDAQLRPRTADLVQLHELFEARRFADVRAAVDEMLPAWALSPRVYWLSAVAARELGNSEDAQLDRFLYQSCLSGLAATGEGTRTAPYRVTYLSDCAELLQWQGLAPQQRGLVRTNRGICECLHCAEGERYFLLDRVLVDEPRLPLTLPASTRGSARSALR